MPRFRSLVSLFLALVFLTALVLPASGESLVTANVVVNGTKLNADAYIVNNRTVVPLRAIFEELGAEIKWDGLTRTVTATKGDRVISLTIDKPTALVSGKTVDLAVPAMIINDRTFVPLRFVSEALDAVVAWEPDTRTAKVDLALACAGGPTVHSGEINAAGETWGVCGSPHIVSEFNVGGEGGPVLTIEAGAVVRFEAGGWIRVGEHEPGGLIVKGTAQQPVLFTAESGNQKAGFWQGIFFGVKTLPRKSSIEHAKIEYGGGAYAGAVAIQAEVARDVAVLLKHVEIRESLYAGLSMHDRGRLDPASGNITISGTKASAGGSGYPIATGLIGSASLPKGNYANNQKDGVLITMHGGEEQVEGNTTWTNLGIPYVLDMDIFAEGPNSPVLTIEAGTKLAFRADQKLWVGQNDTGSLVAVGTLEAPIIFTGELQRQGSWAGIEVGQQAGNETQIENAVVEFAASGVLLNADYGPFIKQTSFRNCEMGVNRYWYEGETDFTAPALGNTFEGNDVDQNEL